VLGQTGTFHYALKTVAGTFPLGDAGPGTAALLFYPSAAIPDASGNVYILDSNNYRIRKITPDGNITTAFTLNVYGNDMKLAKDGSFYITTLAQVIKLAPSGAVTAIAGTGVVGFSGDEGSATSAQLGITGGLTLDSAGNVFFADGNRLREVTVDGKIHTIAGTGTPGYNGEGKATQAQLNSPFGVAVDKSNNIYVADQGNYRVRKISAGGSITTVIGDGVLDKPTIGPAAATHFGVPTGLTVDDSGNLFVTDTAFGAVLEISQGNLTLVAGTFNPFGPSTDRRAVNSSLQLPTNVSLDAAGDLFVVDQGAHRAWEVTPDGFIHLLAGQPHFNGDGGPATSALLNQPADVALDAQGNLYISDNYNYRIRKVTLDGIINTFAGIGIPAYPGDGGSAIASPLPILTAMTADARGTLFIASNLVVFSITPAGIVSLVAGDGTLGDSGDGGSPTKANFQRITGLAVDAIGNIYIADAGANRVRRISVLDGTIGPFVGAGVHGSGGDGALARNAQLNLNSGGALAVDRNGRLYIADNGNSVIRMVTAAGDITTMVGNGTLGHPTDGLMAKATAFSGAAGMTFDTTGNLFITSQAYSEIYRVANGIIQRIAGGGTGPLADGAVATSTAFSGKGIKADAQGNIYIADPNGNAVRKLVMNLPVSAAIADGNFQTAFTGQPLPKALKVMVTGTSGFGVPGVTVNFAVTSGSATLSATSVQTDSAGIASVIVTMGPTPGVVVVTAAVPFLANVQPFQFTATATPAPSCPISRPSIASVKSAGDYGALSTFASGSWLEIKGSNLAIDTRLWGDSDFQGANAPIMLDGTSVSINGKSAFVEYISSTQVNVQAPGDPATGPVQLTVSNCAGTSAAVTVQKTAVAPGLLSPANFSAGGKQYLVAQFPDGTFAGDPNLISGALRPAKPGETITAYGIGFGDVTPSILPGVKVAQANSIPNLTINFGQTPATTTYAGLAPESIGLYQFNITVPNVSDGEYQINLSVGGIPLAQTLYLTVRR
jgi:uncharacterized protein (TIGR03437 family)